MNIRPQASQASLSPSGQRHSTEMVVLPAERDHEAILQSLGDVRSLKVGVSATPQKVVQSHNAGEMVVRRSENQYMTFFTEAVCPLGVVEANTAACALALQLQVSESTVARSAFAVAGRGACTDRGPENKPCERQLAELLYKGLPGLIHTMCEVHMCAGIHKKVFEMPKLDAVVHGAIHAALALRSGSAMMKFRACLREEVASRLQVLQGTASMEAKRYRAQAISMFMQRGANMEKRRLLMAMVPNGEWRHQRIQFHVNQNGLGPQRVADVLEFLVTGLLSALTSSAPPVYARHRWIVADVSTDCLGVLECCHKLGSTVFLRFSAAYASTGVRASLLLAGERLSHYTPTELPSLQDVTAADAADAAGRDPQPGDTSATTSARNADGVDWAVVNARNRREGARFWVGDPLGDLMRMRLLLEPMRAFLEKQFQVSSADFERRQLSPLAAALSRGETGVGARTYRLSVAADGLLDRHFWDKLRAVFEDDALWSIMPPQARTVSQRAVSFSGLSRAGCVFEELIGSTHKRFPHRAFSLLTNPDRAEELGRARPCLLDPFTSGLLEHFGSFADAGFMHCLSTVATLQWVDIAQLESRNATIRRLATVMSTQTHNIDFPHLSALWVLLQKRKRSEPSHARRRPRPRAKASAKTTTRPTKRARAGPYRAFFRLVTLGARGRQSPRAVAARYMAEKRAGTDLYQQAVQLASASAIVSADVPSWQSPFGPRAVDTKRLHRRNSVLALSQSTSHLSEGERAGRIATHAVAAGASLTEGVSIARAVARQARKRRRQEDDAELDVLQSFQHGLGARAVQAFLQAKPQFKKMRMTPLPCAFGTCVKVEPVSGERLANDLAWAAANSKESTLSSALAAAWASAHSTVMDGAPLLAEKEVADAGMCQRLGLCVCSPSGLLLKRRAQALLRSMRSIFKPRTVDRDLLAQGRIVLRISGSPKETDDLDALLRDDAVYVDEWFHVGYVTFSPWMPTVMRVVPVADPGEAPPNDARTYVKSTQEFYTLHRAMQLVVAAETAEMKLYVVEHSGRAIDSCCPKVVPIVEHGGSETERWTAVWPTPPRRRAARGGGGAAPAPPHEGGELDDEGGELGDEGDDEEGAAEGEAPHPPMGDVEAAAALLVALYDDEAIAKVDVGARAEDTEGAPPLPPPPGPPPPVPAPPLPPPPVAVANAPRGAAAGVAARPAGQARGRRAAKASVVLPNGVICYYESNGNFVAYCDKHDRCILTRRAKAVGASGSSEAPRVRKPLGFMASWLEAAHIYPTKEDHWDALSFALAEAEAEAGRATLAAAAGGAELVAEE